MQISRKFLHDRSALSLSIINVSAMLFVVLYVLLRYDNNRHIYSSFRPQLPPADVYGNGTAKSTDFYAFALFAVLSTAISLILAHKIHVMRKNLANSFLILNIIVLIFCFVVVNALFNLGIGKA